MFQAADPRMVQMCSGFPCQDARNNSCTYALGACQCTEVLHVVATNPPARILQKSTSCRRACAPTSISHAHTGMHSLPSSPRPHRVYWQGGQTSQASPACEEGVVERCCLAAGCLQQQEVQYERVWCCEGRVYDKSDRCCR